MKEKFKSYSFWLSVTGAVILLLNNLGKAFGFTVDNEIIYSIVDAVCGVLVVFGVLTMNKKTNSNQTKQTEEKSSENNNNIAQSDATCNDKISELEKEWRQIYQRWKVKQGITPLFF